MVRWWELLDDVRYSNQVSSAVVTWGHATYNTGALTNGAEVHGLRLDEQIFKKSVYVGVNG